ncbi:MAG: DUF4157 domain-containing protein [Pseudanabaena sp. Salubria-1]|nr:DUF4157 domain-containing protein [Pseudanabaena sp. Salubria-1]
MRRPLQDKRVSIIQAKLSIGEPNDKYEQEADATASKVVQQINSPIQDQSVQRETMEEEEELQMKPISSIQREAAMEEDDELQMKPISSIQREAMEEEDELQMKSLVQRRENLVRGEASTDLESSIQSARGSGQPLDAGLQENMGQAMGADFSGVKVHTDSHSDQLNQSIQAKAFTTGQDVFFRQGAYDPNSRGGQELIAHELTHVVQQNGGAVQQAQRQVMQMKKGKPINNKMLLEKESNVTDLRMRGSDHAVTVVGAQASQVVQHEGEMVYANEESHSSLTPLPVERHSVGQSSLGRGILQRTLISHDTRGDSGTEVESIGDIGYLAEYANHLAGDRSVEVHGTPSKKGIDTTLKLTKIDGATIADKLVESLMGSGTWSDLSESYENKLVTHLRSYMKELTGGDDWVEEEDTPTSYIEDHKDHEEAIRDWIKSLLEKLSAATKISEIGSNIPEMWLSDMAYIMYEATKDVYKIQGSRAVAPFVPPFKALISDVDSGKVTKFKYERKYGGPAKSNWGAEFTVAEPAPLKSKYENKAVLHTHYDAADEEPNYAHTKPEAQKFALGFGYTVVNTNRVKTEADKKWKDL